MKTLKESILSRSSHGREGFKAQRREMIEKWLKEYDIENYTINDDFTIDVDGDVDLLDKDLTEFPNYIQFGLVVGGFDCSFNKLTSLEGAPREIGGGFYCHNNRLTSLEGAPKKVNGDFNCSRNKLTSLEGAPKKVRWNFLCSHNNLTSLKGAPKEIRGYFSCGYNKLTSLKEAPEKVGSDFYCSKNTTNFTEKDVREVCKVRDRILVK